MARRTIRIWCQNLHVSRDRSGGGRDILPLSGLSRGDHVHGILRLEIGGRLVPRLGYENADDVCLGSWLRELGGVAGAFADAKAKYVYDEGEQGQPAFVFERTDDSGFLSIVDSQISDGLADEGWQRAEFEAEEFLSEYSRLINSFVTALYNEAPMSAEDWIRAHDGVAPRTPQPMGTALSDRQARRPRAFWAIVIIVVLLNIWYDFRHPLGIIFDVVLVLLLLAVELRKSE